MPVSLFAEEGGYDVKVPVGISSACVDLINGEIAKLINRGYQQVLKTSKTEVAATADHLKALQQFTEELKEALCLPSLYNESLGTVSEAYQYDRVKDRDKPEPQRPKRPWERVKVITSKKKA